MTAMKRQQVPVLVAGCPRSGSTILAHLLTLSPCTTYLEEPLNHQTGVEGTNVPFVYLRADRPNEHYDRIITDILAGKATYKHNIFRPKTRNPLRLLFYRLFVNRYNFRYKRDMLNPFSRIMVSKDPTATLSSEYLHRRYGYKVILTFRHPCAVAASHQRLGWGGGVTTRLLKQKALVAQLSKAVQQLDANTLTPIEKLAWYWRIINETVCLFAQRNPDMLVVQHELFSRQPVGTIERLYQWLDLPFTSRIRRKVQGLTSAGNPTDPRADRAHTLKRNSQDNIERWRKHLSQQDIDTIMKICGPTYEKLQKLPNTTGSKLAVTDNKVG